MSQAPTFTAEELRETIAAMGRELDLLRTEARHASLLLGALDAMLVVDQDQEQDPFDGVLQVLLSTFEFSQAVALVEYEGAVDTLRCVSASHPQLVGSLWPVGRLLGRVLAGRVLTTVAPAEDRQGWPEQARGLMSPHQPALMLPLRMRARRGVVMMLRDCDSAGFDRTHVNLARKFSVLASHAFAASQARQTEIESRRLRRLTERLEASQVELTYRANHDQLTGLPNRSYMEELVNARIAALGGGGRLALAFFDIDQFKQVNDYYGHAVGDALLKGVASRMRAEIRAGDLVGRVSGDEFVMAFAPLACQEQIASMVDRIHAHLREPFPVDGLSLQASVTTGVAVYPDHGPDYETLKRNADIALHRAKTCNKGEIGYYSKALGKDANDRMVLERRLCAALEQSQFTYALQPKVDIRDGRVIGFEALARWVDDAGVVQPPGVFLAAASELGLLDGITHAIVDALLTDLPQLDAQFGPACRYSLNISARQASRQQFMAGLVRRIAARACPARIILELTEETFVAASLFQSQVLPLLREAGIGVSIDDFGTGYSCLSILADITADELKVDRSLVTAIHQRPRSQGILRAIVSLASTLGLDVVAEGIETPEERAYLLESTSILFGQGYLFSRPRFVDELIATRDSEPLLRYARG